MRFGIGLGLSHAVTRRTGGPAYAPEAVSLFSRMSVQPDYARKVSINTLIVALKAAGVWAKLDFLYMFAAHNAQAARTNWIEANEATAIASPIFTADRGYKGDGIGAYLELPYHQQNGLPKAGTAESANASWLVGVRQSGEANRFVIGAATNVRFALLPGTSGASFRNGQGTTSDFFASPLTGRFASTRSGPTAHRGFYNGVSIGTSTTPSAAASGTNILALRGGSTYSSAEITHYGVGAGLTQQEQADADAALATYLIAVGAF